MSLNAPYAPRPLRTASLLLAISLLGGAVAGCATRAVMEPTFERGRVEVMLRSHNRLIGGPIERNYQHPASVSYQRLVHILSAIDVERRDEEQGGLRVRVPAIPAELVEDIAAGVTDGLAKSQTTQEVVVMAVRKEQRLGLFHRKFLTSFVAFVRDDHLHIALSRSEWKIPKEKQGKQLPIPRLGKKVMDFRAVPARGMHSAGAQMVVVPWRNSIYAAPVRPAEERKVGVRRTILFDSPIPEERVAQPETLPADLTPDVLRELATLEEQRRAGTITETQYLQRRAVLLGETR